MMVNRILRGIRLLAAVALVAGLTAVDNAHALSLNLDAVAGTWTDATPQVSLAQSQVTGLGTNEIRWGNPLSSEQAGLKFDGSAPPPVPINLGVAFDLGTLTHFNFPISGNTGITDANLAVALTISNGTTTTAGPLNFTFDILETPNTSLSGCPAFQESATPCDDRITFPSALASEVFVIDGQDLTLELLGFVSGGSTVEEFITEESETSSAVLQARVVEASVPEPTALLLIGSGFLGLAGWGWRRSHPGDGVPC